MVFAVAGWPWGQFRAEQHASAMNAFIRKNRSGLFSIGAYLLLAMLAVVLGLMGAK
jgi:hypothetical protein